MNRRNGGFPLWLYLIALLALPILATGYLGVRELERNDDLAASTSQLTDFVELRASSATMRAPLQVERLASVGLARIGGYGIPVEPIMAATGLDFEQVRNDNNARLELARARVEAAIESELVPASIRTEYEASNLELDRLRDEVNAGTYPHSDDVVAAFGRVEAVLDEITAIGDAAAEQVLPPSQREANVVADLDALSEVATTAAGEIKAVSDALLLSATADVEETVRASLRHEDALAEATSVNVAEVDSLIAHYESLPELNYGIVLDFVSGDMDLQGISDVAQTIMERVDYMNEVADFTFDESEAAVALLADRGAAAERDNTITLIVFLLLAAATILVAFVVARSFARPLFALRAKAEGISSGELSADRLALEGPREVREVTSSVNDMASTLARVDEHMQALAQSDLDGGTVLGPLPGKVGASMRHSMERVTALTRRLRASEARLAEEARIDNLTGLPNRFAVLEYLGLRAEDAHARGVEMERIGVMFLDVDGFKSVNDIHGHAVGDVVLREIAQRLGGSVRPGDFVARLGGDEFLVIVDDTEGSDALEAFGHRMIRAIEEPYEVGDQLFAVSASVGVTVVRSGDDALAAIERADAAVYQAKRRGRRRVEMFDEELQASIEHQAELELALRQAITQDELCIHLQPVADLRTGWAVSAEVLVRWERPGVGMLPPDEFIPIAERSGLIFDLERWVLGAACRQLADWRERGLSTRMRLAVNISGRHLIEGDVIGALDDAVAATGADPACLAIELTESHLLDDVDRAIAVLSAIRQRGVLIAIDDFGTGYSSMTYLQKLPVDVVKIDRSFVGRATTNAFDATVIESVVTLGGALGLSIVAEGIETEEQLDYVTAAGCHLGQGFLLARPMPIADCEEALFLGPLVNARGVTTP